MTMASDAELYRTLLRTDLLTFIGRTYATVDGRTQFLPNFHIELIADRLMAAYRREIKRLIITLPPRSLKSISASIAFPAWALGQDPKLRIICASYAQEFSGDLARKCRKVMLSPWYRGAFPQGALNPNKLAEEEFETIAGGSRLSTSLGGSLTGRGGNFIIIDDPIKALDAQSKANRERVKDWYDSTLYSRLDSKDDDVIILVMQRVHVDDLVAHVQEKEDWELIELPAIAVCDERFELLKPLGNVRYLGRKAGEVLHPAQESRKAIEASRATLGTVLFSAQYQQNPIPPEGNLIKRSWLRDYEGDIEPERIVQSWDVAATSNVNSDWSVCTTWLVKNRKYYLQDVLRGRWEFPDLKRKVVAHARSQRAKVVLIENAHVGIGLIQQLKSEGGVHIIPVQADAAKVVRMATQSAIIEAGSVFLPKRAAWRDAYIAELSAFPGGRNDDQVDSTSQFLNWIEGHGRKRAGILF